MKRQGREVVDAELVLVVIGGALLGELVEVAVVDAVEGDAASVLEEDVLPLEEGVCDSERTATAPMAETPSTATTTRARTLETPGRLPNRRVPAKAGLQEPRRLLSVVKGESVFPRSHLEVLSSKCLGK